MKANECVPCALDDLSINKEIQTNKRKGGVMSEVEKNIEKLMITKTNPEMNKTVEAVLSQELAHTQLVIGWLIYENNECFERAFIVELLKKHYTRLKEKQSTTEKEG